MPRVKKVAIKPVSKKLAKAPKSNELSIQAFSITGESAGEVNVPKEVFGAKVNKSLLAQAARVYLSNSKGHFGSTKTRGEVHGSTRKIWKQKGTGRARHGGIRAPIFVGGGIAFGPKPRKANLTLSKKMKKAALFSAISSKVQNEEAFALKDAEKVSGKTKEIANLVKKINKTNILLVTDKIEKSLHRAGRNLKGSEVLNVENLNAYVVLNKKTFLITEEAISFLANQGKDQIKNA